MDKVRSFLPYMAGFLAFTMVFSEPRVAMSQSSSDPLAAICQGFLSSSGVPAPGNADRLCGCLVRKIQAGLSMAEMQAYQSASAARRALPPDVQNKITSIAVQCIAEAN